MNATLRNAQIRIFFILFSFVLSLSFLSKNVLAAKNVAFVTFEYRPYIGKDLPNQGYVHELIAEVCKRIGYQAQIEYYPLARAKMFAAEGGVDGVFPVFYDESLKEKFLFSDPFWGATLGLLKKKRLRFTYAEDTRKDTIEFFNELQQYDIGMVRGKPVPEIFEQIRPKNIDYADDDLINIDKLYWGRNDLIIIDKYTAADLIVTKRPHYIGQLEFIHLPIENMPFRIAFSTRSEGYRQRQLDFNRGLKEIGSDGTIERIRNKHGLFKIKPAEAGKTRLTIGTVNNEDMIVMQELSKQFEKENPDIDLDWRTMDENTLRLRLLSDSAIADGQFDIMTIGLYETPIWAKNKWIAPIQDLQQEYDKKDLIEAVRENLSYDGQLYALPFYAESSMTYYRTDLFKKAGLEMPLLPTYEDIKTFAAAIHDPENQVYGICLRGKPGWGENMGFLMTLVNTYGGYLFDNQWNPTINSPEWKDAISFYLELMTRYGPPQPFVNGYNENLDLFSTGHCGIWVDATVSAGMLFDPNKSKVYDNLGFAHAPVAITPKGSSWLFAWALAISASSENKEAALQFISWATSKKYIKQVAEKKGWLSIPAGTRKSTYENKDYKAAAPFGDFIIKAIQTSQPEGNSLMPEPDTHITLVGTPEYTAILEHIGQEIGNVLEAKISLEEALLNSQQFASKQIRHSGYIK